MKLDEMSSWMKKLRVKGLILGAKMAERDAWLRGERCASCGAHKDAHSTASTCAKCLEEE